jgi:hypothetical protein
MQHQISNLNDSSIEYTILTDPPGSGTVISFGGITFNPVPKVSMNIETYKTGAFVIGGIMNVTLEGVFHGDNFTATANQLTGKINALASNHKCIDDITIKCGDTAIIDSGIGWIKSYSFPQGEQSNWYNIIPYTIELAVARNSGAELVVPDPEIASRYALGNNYLRSLKEDVSISIDETALQTYSPSGTSSMGSNHRYSNDHIIVKYSIEAQGLETCNGCAAGSGVVGGIEAAKNVIAHRHYNLQTLNDNLFACGSGLFPSGNYDFTKRYNHTRDVSYSELDGSISVNGTYIVRPTGVAHNILLTLDSNADSSIETGEKTITINGNIRGLVENTFSSDLFAQSNEDKINKQTAAMNAAESHLYHLVNSDASGIMDYVKGKNNLITFNNAVGDSKNKLGYGDDNTGENWAQDTNSWTGHDTNEFRLLQKTFKRNPVTSSIDFTLTYSNKNKHKIPYALWADINIEHELPARRLVEHVVPGRGYPLIQDIMCDTLDSYTITVNAQFEPTRNIHKVIGAAAETILLLINETANDLNASSWIRTQDSESIGNNGSYRRTIKLTRHSCFDGATSSSALDYVRMQPPNFSNEAETEASEPSQAPTINIADTLNNEPTLPVSE